MKEVILTSRQQMLSPDQLAYEMGLIPTVQEIENNKKIIFIIIGAFAAVTLVFVGYEAYHIHQKYTIKKRNNKIND